MSAFNFSDFRLIFMSIVFEAMPFIVIGAIVSGMLEELLPQQFFQRFLPKSRWLAVIMSSLLGILMPMCECGIVPVMRRLLKKGVPASCAITYMLSAPGMNFIVLSSTALAFWGYKDGAYDLAGIGGLGIVLLRGGFAFITAVTIGLVVDRLASKGVKLVREDVKRDRLVGSPTLTIIEPAALISTAHHHHDHHDHDHSQCDHDHHHDHHHHASVPAKRTLLDRLQSIAEIALGDFIDIAAFLVIGALLAATINTMLPRATLEDLGNKRELSILAMMGLAFLLSLCSEADAFVAANFTGLSTGSKLAMIVLGPMLDVKLLIMYRWVFTGRMVMTMVPIMLVMIFSLTYLYDRIEPFLLMPPSTLPVGGK
ncbi:permease [bacterium]|nr:permease [bacterium]